MRVVRLASVLCSSFVLATLTAPLASAQSASLGRGMEQLVQMYESGNPKLSQALKPNLLSPAGDVLVEIHLQPGVTADQALPALKRAGFRLTAVSELNHSLVEGYLPLSAARSVAGVVGVRNISAALRPVTFVGSVPSQAVPAEKADLAQARGIDGSGTRIGVLSDSFNSLAAFHPNAADDEATGDLPPTVTVLEDLAPGVGTDEGRAMSQLAHKIAPGAAMAFATADNGQVDFSNNILDLRRVFNADTIVDDVVYFAEPMYSDGLLAQTVDEVVKEGAAYFSSAGNNGLEAYEDVYRPTSLADAKGLVAGGQENIDIAGLLTGLANEGVSPPQSFQTFRNRDGSTSITQKFSSFANNFISFQWDEPFFQGKVQTNFDMYVFDPQGHWLDPQDPNFPGFYTLSDNLQTDEPFEFLFLPFLAPAPGGLLEGDYQLVIGNVNNGPARHIKYVDVNGLGESERQNAPSTFGHADARHGQAVAAQFWAITKFPEDFSSPGPVTIFFDNNGNRLDDPEIRHVPQITGIDGVDTTFFGQFFGTSAAAPDVAAVGNLVIQAAGGPGSISPRKLYDRLQDAASPIRLSRNRAVSAAFAGPVLAVAQGDFTRFSRYFTLAVLRGDEGRDDDDGGDGDGPHSVSSVAFNVTDAGLIFSANPNRFHVGTANGISPSDIKASRSPDGHTATFSFTPGAFHAGSSFTFGHSVFSPLEGTTQEDADRFEGVNVTVTLDDGSIRSGRFFVAPKRNRNRFTGAGLVNADGATRKHHHDDDDNNRDNH